MFLPPKNTVIKFIAFVSVCQDIELQKQYCIEQTDRIFLFICTLSVKYEKVDEFLSKPLTKKLSRVKI